MFVFKYCPLQKNESQMHQLPLKTIAKHIDGLKSHFPFDLLRTLKRLQSNVEGVIEANVNDSIEVSYFKASAAIKKQISSFCHNCPEIDFVQTTKIVI